MAVDRRLGFAALIPILVAALLSLPISSPRSAIDDYEWFEDGARMHILASVVRPRFSACEQYPFFDFPFCPPGEPINRTKSFKDLLNGDCFTDTRYEVRFKTKEERKILCQKTLTKEEIAKFKLAIRRNFVFGLAHSQGILWSQVGIIEEHVDGPQYYLVTNLNFHIKYCNNRVVSVKLVRGDDADVEITKDAETRVNFTYSVFWEKTRSNNPILSEKGEMVNDSDDGRCNLALLNVSIVTVLSCVIMLLIVTLPYLMSYSCYSYIPPRRVKECSDKRIRYDSCDYPQNTSLLGAVLGNGIQLLIMVCQLFVFANKGYLRPCNIRSLGSRIMQSYFLASVIAGYMAVSFHGRFSQDGWKECIFQAATIYFIPVLVTTLLTNCLAVLYSRENVSELDIIFAIVPYWEFAIVVFITLGGVLAHYSGSEPQSPRVTTRRAIPFQPWYMKTPIHMLLGALIPSAALFHEMDKIYASLWNFKTCGAFQTLFLPFIFLIFTTVLTAICCTMAKYDHQWWWRSVLRGGSPAIFMFVYGIYFFARTGINERLVIRIVGYNACISYGMFLVLGSISFYASSLVVHVKHELLKMD